GAWGRDMAVAHARDMHPLVLAIDDEPSILGSPTLALEAHGVEVMTAKDGKARRRARKTLRSPRRWPVSRTRRPGGVAATVVLKNFLSYSRHLDGFCRVASQEL
ncbi:MAG: hypothetical protein ACREDI_05540, partial [Roseiarcus sp.]